MQLRSFLSLAITLACARATLDPCTTNSKGKIPSKLNCSATKVSKAIQAAECSHNTRTSKTQTFAVFVTDHSYDKSYGAPYGTCSAYTCAAPTSNQTESEKDSWIFYWGEGGDSTGYGTTCVKSPDDGTCGCQNSNGQFIYGGNDCV
ncbi:uncharacterized protein RCC_07904 [Ramularia collo-cygni]|uniref:Small secreted protein n=1 Tax=Ramularia collo-cygni TaxID=112498 RepID=A0A2D3V5S0_9PEZI|nr:uncharacterized protein RCC_07904 [Ramularia collo-cygni]CZT22035.1 uncharacterized protein RCC_07904 [Ramularia collo-cygni]